MVGQSQFPNRLCSLRNRFSGNPLFSALPAGRIVGLMLLPGGCEGFLHRLARWVFLVLEKFNKIGGRGVRLALRLLSNRGVPATTEHRHGWSEPVPEPVILTA